MLRLLKQIIASQKGQALPIVLALLVLGGLTIVPSLNYAATGLRSGQVIKSGVDGLYAAEAGVENTLWCLQNAISPPQQLTESINQMQVAIQTEEEGTYTLYFGELVEAGVHCDWLAVDGEVVWDAGEQAYKHTITITWQPESGQSVIHLLEIGARIPIGYSYSPGSASYFVDNLSTEEPGEVLDAQGVYLLNWEMNPPHPYVSLSNPVKTQTFYISGQESQEGDYSWVVASSSDIGEVGEITGTAYRITATATNSENVEISAIVADVMLADGAIYILSWQVSK